MLKINDLAPEFSLKDKNGKAWGLKDFRAKYLIIYFYPKDSTPGCTVEARGFNQNIHQFRKWNAEIAGISGGDEATKKKFCEQNYLDLTLLSDKDYSVSAKYHIYGEKTFLGKKFMGINRTTFILDSNRKIIAVFDKVHPETHAEEVLSFIKDL